MALRRYLVIMGCLACALGAQVKRYPLDERTSYLVTIGTEAPTTVVFPEAVGALDGAGVGAKVEDNPPVLIAHTPGAAHFSVRALRPEAVAAVNVLVRGRAYALTFRAGPAVDRTVTFYGAKDAGGEAPVRLSAGRLLNLLDRARAWPQVAAQYPALAAQVPRATPGHAVEVGGLRVTVEEVLRFEPEDAVVLTLRLENPGAQVRRYRADRLGVRVGDTSYPVALTDAAGEVPPRARVRCWVVVAGAPDGSRAALAVDNGFVPELIPLP